MQRVLLRLVRGPVSDRHVNPLGLRLGKVAGRKNIPAMKYVCCIQQENMSPLLSCFP